jgi:hypothetical protein
LRDDSRPGKECFVLTYHVCVQSGHELAGSARQGECLVQTVVEVTGLEVVRLAGDFLAGHVVQIRVGDGEVVDGILQRCGSTVIEHDHSEPVEGVVLINGTTDGIENDLILFTAAGDEDIYRRAVITGQSQLRSAALLHGHHRPAVVHERRNHDGNLNANENPRTGITDTSRILSRNDAVDSQTQVEQVESGVSKGQQRGELEDDSLPALPDIDIVTITDASDGSRLNPIL